MSQVFDVYKTKFMPLLTISSTIYRKLPKTARFTQNGQKYVKVGGDYPPTWHRCRFKGE